jgi:methanogenic corrinoid protein MtbC1
MSAPVTVRVRDHSGLVARYLELLAAGDTDRAVAWVVGLRDAGLPSERIMLDVLAPAAARVGKLWQDNLWSVAQEHTATAVSERAVAAIAVRPRVQPGRGRVTVACVDGEWHLLPVRILSEVLRLRGWHVDLLGVDVSGPQLVAALHRSGADTTALSCMLPSRLPHAHAAIVASQSAGVPVLAGGRGFGPDDRLARLLGANGWAARPDTAADLLAADSWPPPAVGPPRPAPVAGAAYSRLLGRRAALIDAALTRLAEVPASQSGPWRDSVVDDLGQLVDFLAAARYVGEATIVTDFVAWLTRVLAARGVPAERLVTSLDAYRAVLPDDSVARAMLARAAHEVRTVPEAGGGPRG